MSASLGSDPAILLVDDNPHDVVLLRLAFRRVGIIDPIKLVKDGAEAVHYLSGNGVYADRHSYPVPTLMDVERAYRLGADSFLVKPTKFSELVTMTQALKGYCSVAS